MSLKLGFSGPSYGYAMDLGLPVPSISYFSSDPEIKPEAVWAGEALARTNTFAERRGPIVRIRKDSGEWNQVLSDLASSDSMMTRSADPHNAVELLLLRERMRE
jgi:predicted ATPase